MSVVESTQPCGVEAKLWRECLKEFDYGPDKPRGACETQRVQYYNCIKDWRQREADRAAGEQKKSVAPTVKDYEMVPECSHDAEKLHQCMMMNAFEVTKCPREMTLLKRCAASHNVEVRRYLEGDPAIAEYENCIDNATGLRRLWYKAIGKL